VSNHIEKQQGMIKKDIFPLTEEQKAVLRDILPAETVAFKPVYKSIEDCSPRIRLHNRLTSLLNLIFPGI
jgi:hypothetical protein